MKSTTKKKKEKREKKMLDDSTHLRKKHFTSYKDKEDSQSCRK